MCVRERESVCLRTKHMGVCVKSLEVGLTIIACLSVCQPVCQPSNHHKLAQFITSANIESFNPHHWVPPSEWLHLAWEVAHTLHHKSPCWSTLSLPQSQTHSSCHTHVPFLLLSQNMTFFSLSPLAWSRISWQWSWVNSVFLAGRSYRPGLNHHIPIFPPAQLQPEALAVSSCTVGEGMETWERERNWFLQRETAYLVLQYDPLRFNEVSGSVYFGVTSWLILKASAICFSGKL